MGFNDISIKLNRLVAEHSASILTAVGMTGTVTTAVLTGRAAFKAARLIEETEEEILINDKDAEISILSITERVKLTWTLFIPAVGAGATTVSAIFFANQIASKKSAALAAAYGLSDKAFQEYKDKVVEKLGEKKELAVRDELAQDRVNNSPINDRQVIIVGNGDVLCFDSLSGRYFQSTMESIKKAENTVNHDIIHHMYASLSKFYDEIGLPPTAFSDNIGWNTNNILDLSYSTTFADDGRPCLVIDFNVPPISDYGKLY